MEDKGDDALTTVDATDCLLSEGGAEDADGSAQNKNVLRVVLLEDISSRAMTCFLFPLSFFAVEEASITLRDARQAS